MINELAIPFRSSRPRLRCFIGLGCDWRRRGQKSLPNLGRYGIVSAMKYGSLICLSAILASFSALAQSNPVPLVNQPLVPMTLPPGGSSFTLTVNGTGFVSGSVVDWNGAPLATTFVSGSQLTASVPASEIASAGTASVTVVSPTPGGGKSNVQYFDISSPATTLTFTQLVPYTWTNGSPLSPSPLNPIAADFNGDGKLDLAYFANNAVVIQLGNGDGSFQAPMTVLVNSPPEGPSSMVARDFNGDGKLDLAVSYYDAEVSILLGNGDGTFQPPLTFATGGYTTTIVAGDFNEDGKLDVATAGDVVSILLGNGDGTFQPHIDYPAPGIGYVMAVGDFNQDGKLDLVYSTTDVNGEELAFLQGNGNGTFQPPVNTFSPEIVSAIIAADLNGDGKLDLVGSTYQSGDVLAGAWVWLGNGDGTFQSPASYDGGNWSADLAAQDFNADNKLDVVLANYLQPYSPSDDFGVALGNGDGTFQDAIIFPIAFPFGPLPPNGFLPLSSVAGDFNGDGKMDLVFALQLTPGSIIVFLQGQFPAASPSPTSLTFAQQTVGTTSAPQVVTLTNTGSATLTIASFGVNGANAGDFGETNNCPASLVANANCQVNVTFTPQVNGNATASLNIVDNAPGSAQSVSLTGTTPAIPVLSFSPTSLTFPSQYVGTSGLPQTVTLTNTGTATLTIASLTVSPPDFGILSQCGSNIGPGGSCAIGVFFDPTAGGSRTGALTVTDNASGSPQVVTLTGMGQDFSLAPSGSSSATVTAGQTATYKLAIAPVGAFTQKVALTCNGAPEKSTCSLSPNSLVLNGSSPATVTVTVTTTGSSASLVHPFQFPPVGGRIAIWLAFSGLSGLALLGGYSGKSRRRRFYALVILCLFSIGGGSSGCGRGSTASTSSSVSTSGSAGTPAGSYSLTVAGAYTTGSATLTHSTKLTLVVQ
jgi:hypothetical protein